MSAQTREIYQQDVTLGSGSNAWKYRFRIHRVTDPFPSGTVPESSHFNTIPSYIYITAGNQKESFDLGHLGDGDTAENVTVTVMDDSTGQYLSGTIFTSAADNVVYQFQILTDKGSGGALKTIHFGEIDPRQIVFEPEYMSVSSGLRKQKATFLSVDLLAAALQKMPFGDNTLHLIDFPWVQSSGTNGNGQPPALNTNLPATVIPPSTGLMNGFPNYKTVSSFFLSNLNDNDAISNAPGNDVFASFDHIIAWTAQVIANRAGVTTGAKDTSAAFSHFTALSYGGSLSAAGTAVSDIPAQIALQRTAFLSSSTILPPGDPYVPTLEDYSLSKQGTAHDGLQMMLEAFVQYGVLSFDDAGSTITLTIKTPLDPAPAAFLTKEPVLKKAKWNPFAFSARSVSGKLINPNQAIATSTTDPGTPGGPIATNNQSIAVLFPNSSIDIATQLFVGTYWNNTGLLNQLAVFENGPDYTTVHCIDSNTNGEMQSGGNLLHPISVRRGFSGAVASYDALSLTDAVVNMLYSLFCGQKLTALTGWSRPLEIFEATFPVDASVLATDGTYIDTTGIDTALLKTIPLTSDSLHTFIIISCDTQIVGEVRETNIIAVRSLP